MDTIIYKNTSVKQKTKSAVITVYGIPNCDTIKKVLGWFIKKKIEIVFWDYKTKGIAKEKLNGWCKQVGWEVLLHKKSTTWRSLALPDQEKITSQAAAIKLMIENTSIIKRPVVEYGGNIFVGFDEAAFSKQFSK